MKEKKLVVWWIANPPNSGVRIPVDSVYEAKIMLKALTEYDLYLGELVGSSAGGLEELDEYGWSEYYSKSGQDIMEIIDEEVNNDKA